MLWNADASGAVDIKFEASLDTGPLDTPVWAYDLSSYLLGRWRSFHGKRSLLDDLAPGTLLVELDNSLRTFDPAYTAGPFYGKLKPMKRVRLTVTIGVTTLTVFTGFVTSWSQTWGTRTSVAEVSCVDGTRLFRNQALPASAYASEVLADAPIWYAPLQGSLEARIGGSLLPMDGVTAASAAMGRPLGEDLGTTLTVQASSQALASVALATLPVALEGWFLPDGNVTNSQWLTATVSSSTFMRISVSGDGEIELWYSNAADTRRIINATSAGIFGTSLMHVVFYRSGNTVYLMVNGSVVWSSALAAATTTTSFTDPGYRLIQTKNAGSTVVAIGHAAAYSVLPSDARFYAHYAVGMWANTGAHGDYGWEYSGARINRILDDIGWPTGDRDIDTGTVRHGAYLPAGQPGLTGLRDVERAEQGLLFVDSQGRIAFRARQHRWTAASAVTFADDGTGIDYVAGDPEANSVDTITNRVTVNHAQGSSTVRNTTSSNEVGESSDEIDCPTLPDSTAGTGLASYLVRIGSASGTVFPALTVDMIPDPATQILAVAALEVGSIVTVKRTPMSVGDPIVEVGQLLGVEHDCSGEQWTATLYMAPVDRAVEQPYLILGDAAFGALGLWSPLLDETGAVIRDESNNPIFAVGDSGQMIPW